MKKKSFLKIGGAMLLLAIVLNIQYAWATMASRIIRFI